MSISKPPEGYRFLINLPDESLVSEHACRDHLRALFGTRCASLAMCRKGSKKANTPSAPGNKGYNNGMNDPIICDYGWTVFVPVEFKL